MTGKTKIFLSVITLLLLIIVGCNDLGVAPNPAVLSGKYKYEAYDEKNAWVASGYITIFVNDSLIVGSKDIKDTGNEPQLESGEGSIFGIITDKDKLQLFLTGTEEPILLISGIYKDKSFYGIRIYDSDTLASADTLGKFVAVFTEEGN